ncbi:aminotransferase class V-fold PLP-dependent enzyme [Streptomyces sp. NBC_01275]|uniref:pyridoxal-phosphate-dependent aminotransferase family protein n=1 Tax=Streptomyces sp. NBC_01275 TaxID=2903807 RepID=UPI00224CDA8A|nr:aminotransferase class V-fold PLP-dependent enzyme [Streptomyces sp. NBC_01275]MCX4763945.1 aminotransferase class V-fold PLP-dependent enzyme [Streptomyces sp. NBC_01275]
MSHSTTSRPQRLVLMNPGPVITDDRVRSALAGPDMCHREPEFSDLLTRVRHKTTLVAGGDERHSSVVLTGSGTSAVEAAVSSAVPAQGGLLVLDNGHYGERFHHIAAAHGIRSRRLDMGWATSLDLSAVEDALAADPALTHVGVVHHETSSGMLNDVAAVTRIAHEHGREVIVDAVSSIGAESVSLADDGIDWLAGSANKCLEGAPGLAFVCAARQAFEALADAPRRSYYLDLYRHYTAQAKAAAPAFTPGIPAFYAFETALDLVLAEGPRRRHARYEGLARQLRSGLEELGLDILLPPHQRAVGLTAVRIPEALDYTALHRGLRTEGFVIYSAQERLSRNFFRLSTMGCMTAADVDRFLVALARLLPGKN